MMLFTSSLPFFLISVDLQYEHCTVQSLNSSLYYATPRQVVNLRLKGNGKLAVESYAVREMSMAAGTWSGFYPDGLPLSCLTPLFAALHTVECWDVPLRSPGMQQGSVTN